MKGSQLYDILSEAYGAMKNARLAQAKKHYEQLERDLAKLEGREVQSIAKEAKPLTNDATAL